MDWREAFLSLGNLMGLVVEHPFALVADLGLGEELAKVLLVM